MSTRRRTRAGQAIVFLIMVVVILAFVVMWNFDIHKILHVKSVTQNAGDAAALMAARWQGISLNLMGELNMMHALALVAGDAQTAEAVTNIQARLCYVGPMVAFMASQQAAKNNGVYVHGGFTDRVRAHADRVRYDYPFITGPDGEPLFPEPYPGAWDEYADMLDTVADNGIAAAPDNTRLYTDATGGHPLLDTTFYTAIAGQTWCWFYHNYRNYNVPPQDPPLTLLEAYENYPPTWWPELPMPPHIQYINSEVYSLGMTRFVTTLGDVAGHIEEAGLADPGASPFTNAVEETATWYGYAGHLWTAWDAIDVAGDTHFPVVGPVRPQYDYQGADAVARIEAGIERLTPGEGGSEVRNDIVWTAAAKPFGYLPAETRPDAYGIVLPAYRDVRLFPVGASTAPSGGAYNLPWRVHIEDHLPEYMNNGPGALEPACWYCRQLDNDPASWENAAFRQTGAAWLAVPENAATCLSGPGGPGGPPGGGTIIAH